MAKLQKRYLADQVVKDLNRKMVFVGGPRQVGKTTMAKNLPRQRAGYLNWDIAEHRERILKREMPVTPLWVLDEIHKYHSWRNLLKGFYDLHGSGQKILVTGSARLDFYRFGGDSLQGRYHYLRLHPLKTQGSGTENGKPLLHLLHSACIQFSVPDPCVFLQPFGPWSALNTRLSSKNFVFSVILNPKLSLRHSTVFVERCSREGWKFHQRFWV